MVLRAWRILGILIVLTANAVMYANPVTNLGIDGTATPSLTQDFYQRAASKPATAEPIRRTEPIGLSPPTAKAIVNAFHPLLVRPL